MVLNFKKEYILENEYVQLRPLKATDIEHLLEFSINEPEIWRFNSRGADGEEHLKEYVFNAIEQRNNEKEYPFIVFDKVQNKYVGSTRFYAFNRFNNTIDLGYTWYGKAARGTAVNKSCKFLMLQFAFEELNLDRVGFTANIQNERSIRAMMSIGCEKEGVLRSFYLDNSGNRVDAIVLSVLKSEWHESVKDKLKTKILKKQNR